MPQFEWQLTGMDLSLYIIAFKVESVDHIQGGKADMDLIALIYDNSIGIIGVLLRFNGEIASYAFAFAGNRRYQQRHNQGTSSH
jgi:hypothetical protein